MAKQALSDGKRQQWRFRAMLCLVTLTAATMPHLVPAASLAAKSTLVQRPVLISTASAPELPPEKVAAASGLPFDGATALDRYRALTCLTTAIYYEAANEPEEGQRAVAQVILNRVRHPAWPHSICGVVYQGTERTDLKCQFTFSCDGSMARLPLSDKWARAREVAQRALAGDVFAPVGMATYYHSRTVRPDWARQLDPVAAVGAHVFYRMRGINGTPTAFDVSYAGRELLSGPGARAFYKPTPAAAAGPYALPFETATIADDTLPTATRPDDDNRDTLPESTIRPEYRNTGRPLL